MQVFLYVFEKNRIIFSFSLSTDKGAYGNRQLNSRSAACSSFKYKKEKSYFKKIIKGCVRAEILLFGKSFKLVHLSSAPSREGSSTAERSRQFRDGIEIYLSRDCNDREFTIIFYNEKDETLHLFIQIFHPHRNFRPHFI